VQQNCLGLIVDCVTYRDSSRSACLGLFRQELVAQPPRRVFNGQVPRPRKRPYVSFAKTDWNFEALGELAHELPVCVRFGFGSQLMVEVGDPKIKSEEPVMYSKG
jgi:hypothetical protein